MTTTPSHRLALPAVVASAPQVRVLNTQRGPVADLCGCAFREFSASETKRWAEVVQGSGATLA